MTKPILMAVHEHPRELATIQRELLGRYAADYEVIAEASASAALERLEALRGTADARVVVLLAAHAMTGMTGIEYLQRAHAFHPRAQRVLLLPWGNRSAIKPILKAISRGQIDRYATQPSRPPDERFHHLVTELLRDWQEQQFAERNCLTHRVNENPARQSRNDTLSANETVSGGAGKCRGRRLFLRAAT